MRPIERIGGPLEPVPPVVAPPRGQRPGRRTERDAQRDDARRRRNPREQQPARRPPPAASGEGHVDVVV